MSSWHRGIKRLTFAAMPVLGMPLDAWILLAVSVGLGLGLELAHYRARRRDHEDDA